MSLIDMSKIKKNNRNIVLENIIHQAPISRAKIAQLSSLNKATISSQTSDLLKDQLIFEIGEGQSSGGRKPVMLVFNNKAGFTVGIDLGIDYILTIVSDLEGNIEFEDFDKIGNITYEETKQIVIDKIHLAIKNTPDSPHGLIGIGIGIHGFINNDQLISFTPNSNWKNVDLKADLEKVFDIPITIENEANAGAYGEIHFGGLTSDINTLYISIKTGIGAGIIINGQLYKGLDGFSGEIGHTTINFNGPKCHCGNKGCWEIYASERAYLNHLSDLKGKDIHINVAIDLIKDNDKQALACLNDFASFIGFGLSNTINTFNTDSIMISSSLVNSHPLVMNTIIETIKNRKFDSVKQNTKIMTSTLGKYATALGVSAFIVNKFLFD
ncbi:ROK family protein [Scopulibacillus cellulosilyticus]|uniref:ROK family protein n=1 Tax=Scopulibacillus cellulosilyticus TaxID=2665665 RepID=A0ABW2Q2H1_9BACL